MKKILIVSILLCFGLLGYSQTFPLKSSKWYYANNGGSQPPNSTLRIVQYEKDTVVNDTLSQMLSNGLIFYSEKDSVFYYNPDQNRFGLLYDYSAEVGDTIELITPAGTPSDKLSFKIKIESVTKQVYGNDTVIRFSNTSLDPDFGFSGNVYMTRIGSNFILPHWGISIPEGDYLKCYEDSSLYINYSGIPCDSLVTGIKVLHHDNIEIFPNPASNEIVIRSSLTQRVPYVLFDKLGRVIIRDFLDLPKSIVDISNIDSGLYFLRLRLSEDAVVVKQILVE